jgi:hypothetical protein
MPATTPGTTYSRNLQFSRHDSILRNFTELYMFLVI